VPGEELAGIALDLGLLTLEAEEIVQCEPLWTGDGLQ
jgi:hypothetical protein